MKQTVQIAIDGPAGAGKSTVAKIIAHKLDFMYIDTGAMYRALTYKILEQNIDITNIPVLLSITKNTSITFDNRAGIANQVVFCDGKDVTDLIRSPDVNNFVSKIALIPEIRKDMVTMQQKLSSLHNVIMDGRDIGTIVLPKAKYKFFLTASLEERARRRSKELIEKGYPAQYQRVLQEISNRDTLDITRETSPLRPAEDAILIDTSILKLDDVVAKILNVVMKGEKDAL